MSEEVTSDRDFILYCLKDLWAHVETTTPYDKRKETARIWDSRICKRLGLDKNVVKWGENDGTKMDR